MVQSDLDCLNWELNDLVKTTHFTIKVSFMCSIKIYLFAQDLPNVAYLQGTKRHLQMMWPDMCPVTLKLLKTTLLYRNKTKH